MNWACQPDVVRAAQKDARYSRMLREDFRATAQSLVGEWRADEWEAELDLAANFAYSALTVGRHCSTLGEEYSDIMQVTTRGQLPSRQRSLVLVLLQSVGPYLLQRLERGELRLPPPASRSRPGPHAHSRSRRGAAAAAAAAAAEDQDPVENTSPRLRGARDLLYIVYARLVRWWNKFVAFAARNASVLPYLQKANLALFYLAGVYYSVPKRLASMRYVFLRRLNAPRAGYEILGLLLVIELALRLAMHLRRRVERHMRARTEARAAHLSGEVVVERKDEKDWKGDGDEEEDDGEDDDQGEGGDVRGQRRRRAAARAAHQRSTSTALGLDVDEFGFMHTTGVNPIEVDDSDGDDAAERKRRPAATASTRPGGILSYSDLDLSSSESDEPLGVAAESNTRAKRTGTGSEVGDGEEEDEEEEDEEDEEEDEDDEEEEEEQCIICASARQQTTATECGHLFCWTCIAECLTNKAECPLCRQPCELTKLVRLAHYARS